ncbi:hypothetical protein CYMTET_33040 [Cymbomonas tetramitiformis]|uniref:Sulfotransferase n=1 Tax=Cymbomonas tetramitiformis TaxID=36881 RepID=A0AAE0FDY2_9CHLO|nr:hypothetical protein CYMTET_33040 [Cymbomonas tetramitiformis]
MPPSRKAAVRLPLFLLYISVPLPGVSQYKVESVLTALKGSEVQGNANSTHLAEYLTPVQLQAIQESYKDGHIKHVVFFHLTKAGGTTVDGLLKQEADHHGIPLINIRFFNQVQGVTIDKGRPAFYTTEVWHQKWRQKFLRAGYLKFTVIRDPLERALSWFYFRKADPRPKYQHYKKMSLQRFLRDSSNHNFYLRAFQIRWSADVALSARKIGSELYRVSPNDVLAMLEREFVVVGVLERMAETMGAVRRLFGLNSTQPVYSQNMHSGRPKAKEVMSLHDIKVFRRHNRADIAIYQRATELFNTTIKALAQEAAFVSYVRTQRAVDELGCAGGGKVAVVGGLSTGENRAGGCMTFGEI